MLGWTNPETGRLLLGVAAALTVAAVIIFPWKRWRQRWLSPPANTKPPTVDRSITTTDQSGGLNISSGGDVASECPQSTLLDDQTARENAGHIVLSGRSRQNPVLVGEAELERPIDAAFAADERQASD